MLQSLGSYRRANGWVHLQNVGDVHGVPAKDVQPGMRRMYNFGITSDIVSVNVTDTWVVLRVRYANGKEYDERKRPTTLIAAYWSKA